MRTALLLAIAAIGLSNSAAADSHFSPTRNDKTVPVHCTSPDLRHFALKQSQVIYGVKGAVSRGFTHEFPISREEAQYLWMVFLGNKENDARVQAEVRRRKLESAFTVLKEARASMDFAFEKEGDVLEALAIHDLTNRFPPPRYFVTGGIEYKDAPDPRTVGELDLVVAERDDCQVVLIGETKLGVKQLRHAREQLARFASFLQSKCREAGTCN